MLTSVKYFHGAHAVISCFAQEIKLAAQERKCILKSFLTGARGSHGVRLIRILSFHYIRKTPNLVSPALTSFRPDMAARKPSPRYRLVCCGGMTPSSYSQEVKSASEYLRSGTAIGSREVTHP